MSEETGQSSSKQGAKARSIFLLLFPPPKRGKELGTKGLPGVIVETWADPSWEQHQSFCNELEGSMTSLQLHTKIQSSQRPVRDHTWKLVEIVSTKVIGMPNR